MRKTVRGQEEERAQRGQDKTTDQAGAKEKKYEYGFKCDLLKVHFVYVIQNTWQW